MVPRIQEPPLAIATTPIMEEQHTKLYDAPDSESLARPTMARRATAPEPPNTKNGNQSRWGSIISILFIASYLSTGSSTSILAISSRLAVDLTNCHTSSCS